MGENSKELTCRKGDGLEVTLWWVENTIDTYVEVVDHKTVPPSHYHIEVVPPTKPNEVFEHPFAYIENGHER